MCTSSRPDRRRLLVAVAREREAAGELPNYAEWASRCAQDKHLMQRTSAFDNVAIKPQRVYAEMNDAFDRDTRRAATRWHRWRMRS